MKIILKKNFTTLFLLPLLLPIMAILIPVAFIGHALGGPARKKRHKKLLEIIATKWRQNKKYIYLCYSEDWNLAGQLEQRIIPKHKDYLVIDSWSDSRFAWTDHYDDEENRVQSIVQDIFGDYDGDFDTYVGFIDTDRWDIDTDKTLSYMQSSKGCVLAEGREKTAAEAIDEIDRAIESHLKSVNVGG